MTNFFAHFYEIFMQILCKFFNEIYANIYEILEN